MMKSKLWVVLAGIVSCACSSGGGSELERSAAESQALVGSSDYGWITVAPGSFSQGGAWQSQSVNSAFDPPSDYYAGNSFSNPSTGRYTATFQQIGAVIGGNVQVTSLGNGHCSVLDWWSSGTTLNTDIACFAPDGTPAETGFTASYYREVSSQAQLGYVWADQPTAANYTPSLTYQFNSTGQTNTITRSGVGNYTVVLPGVQDASHGGTTEVTAYGSTLNHCKVGFWSVGASNVSVNVRCFANQAPVDSMFTLAYGRLTTHGGKSAGYAWSGGDPSRIYQGGQIQSQSVAPHPLGGGSIQITRTALGTYQVFFPQVWDVSQYGNAKVTAYGSGPEFCSSGGWTSAFPTTSPGSTVTVNCFNGSGAPADTLFTVAMATSGSWTWSQFTSDEFAPALCGANSGLGGAWCTGSYCDNISLLCQDFYRGTVDHNTDTWSNWFSEEGGGFMGCPTGYAITGLACSGSYCDNVQLRCSQVNGVTLSQCAWRPWQSEEQGAQEFGTSVYATAASCSGSYCDNMQFYVCALN